MSQQLYQYLPQRQQLAAVLCYIRTELQRLNHWQTQQPSAAALASQQPFAVDTLSFFEWTQWIMLPRFNALIEQSAPLPANCNIAPMAETCVQQEGIDGEQLITLFHRLDQILNGTH